MRMIGHGEGIEKPVRAGMRPVQALLAGAMLLCGALLVYEAGSEAQNISWWTGSAPWIVWIISPYVTLFFLGRRLASRTASVVLHLLAVVTIGFGAFGYTDGFFFHLDAQSALLFLFVPLYQWLAIAVGGIIMAVVVVIRKTGYRSCI